MPHFPIVDAHVHLWNPNTFRMFWVDDAPTLNTPFDLTEYAQHTKGVSVEAMVYLEVDVAPHYALQEVAWVATRAKQDARLKAIVAHAPLEYGEQVRAYLENLKSISPLVRGVRRLVQSERDPDFQLQPRFVCGTQLLAEFGLSSDLCIKHHQLPATIELVQRCPETQFMLDHIGKPDIANGEREPWRSNIFRLAQLPNVMCKISGLVTEADHANWTTDHLRPYVETVCEAFGEDRVAFGGDWPVCTLASTYLRWVETLDELTQQLSDTARQKLWRDNALRFYRIA